MLRSHGADLGHSYPLAGCSAGKEQSHHTTLRCVGRWTGDAVRASTKWCKLPALAPMLCPVSSCLRSLPELELCYFLHDHGRLLKLLASDCLVQLSVRLIESNVSRRAAYRRSG